MNLTEYRYQKARELPSEHAKQCKFFQWANDPIVQKLYPATKWLYAVPNGFYSTAGQKAKMIREGLKSGVWDIGLDFHTDEYTGLRIEMKHAKGRLTSAQKEWQEFYESQGMLCVVCYSHAEAVDAVLIYLGVENE